MAKTYLPAGGGLTFKPILRFVGPLPLDGRGVVDSLSDISGQAYKTTFGGSEFEDVASYYEGMLVVTKDTGKLYVLNGGTFKEVTPDLSGIQGDLTNIKADIASIPNTYVPKTLKINNKALSGDITLSASDIGLGNVTNLAASDYFTVLTSDTTNAIQITVGDTTKEITVATLKTSLGLGNLAYKDSLLYSDVGALSATGTAVKANALNLTQAIGNTKTPVYFNAEGIPVALNYTIETSVPANAVFTDTTYTFKGGTNSFSFAPIGGSEQTVNITPSITNNVTYTGNLTAGQVATFEGTTGTIKASGYTIAKSVPSNAIFTDEKVNVSAWNSVGKKYITGATSNGNTSLDYNSSVYIEKSDSNSEVTLVAPSFTGALKGTADNATTAVNLTEAPTVTNSADSKDIIITVGGKSSSNIRIPYATSSLHATGAEEAEYSSISGKAETLDWEPVTNEITINFGFSVGDSSEIDTNLLESETVTLLDKNKYNTVFMSPTKESENIGYFIVQFSEANSKYQIVSIKSNGFNIPTGLTANGLISANQLPKDSIIKNLEVVIKTL